MKEISVSFNGVVIGEMVLPDLVFSEVIETDKGEYMQIRFAPVFLCTIPNEMADV